MQEKFDKSLPVLIMGFGSSLLQIICLRQLLTVFSGNELDIGITLAVWLTAVGIGSYTGHRFRQRHAFAASFVLIGLISLPAVLSINLIRPALALEFGETLPLSLTLLTTIICLAPLCLLVGVQFPLAVGYTKSASKAYSLEAAGAFAGGVAFTLFFSGRLDTFTLAAGVGILNLAAAFALTRIKYLLLLLLIPLLLFFGIEAPGLLQPEGFALVERAESRYGDITVLAMRDQSYVFSSGKFQFSYPDPQTEELHVHLPMSVHPAPQKILVIGGSPGVLREFLRYPAAGIDFVEMDPKMIDISMKLIRQDDRESLRDPRLAVVIQDAGKYVKSRPQSSYDLIILNLPEPSTANINRFYTVEFFLEAKRIMTQTGILAFSLQTSSGYIGRKMQKANGSIYASARAVFPAVEVSSEEYGYFFASSSPIDANPDNLRRRFISRAVKTSFFYPDILADAFAPLKVETVKDRLINISSINTDARPVSYLYNLMLWAEMHGGSILSGILIADENRIYIAGLLLLLIGTVIGWIRRQAVSVTLFTTGFTAMAFSMIIILTFQAVFGYVYEMIGLLTAFFMIGMAAGAAASRAIQRPLPWMLSLEAASACLFVLSPLLFRNEPSFYMLNFICGVIAGVQFASANLFKRGEDAARTAGRLYAMELSGSFAGAVAASLMLIPVLGQRSALICLAVMKGASLFLLAAGRYEKA